MNSSKFKKYIKELSAKDLINQLIFYSFFGLAILLFDWSFVCRLITWFLDFLLISSTLFLMFSPKLVIEEVQQKYKKHNPIRNGINEFICLIFVVFLTISGFWFTLSLYILNITLITMVFSCRELTKRNKNEN